jgi:hypothetical protein
MTAEERALLLAVAAIIAGQSPVPLAAEDKEFLAPLIGKNDWATVHSGLMTLIRAVAG